MGHQLDVRAFACQQRVRNLAIGPRQNPEPDRQRARGKNRGEFFVKAGEVALTGRDQSLRFAAITISTRGQPLAEFCLVAPSPPAEAFDKHRRRDAIVITSYEQHFGREGRMIVKSVQTLEGAVCAGRQRDVDQPRAKRVVDVAMIDRGHLVEREI